MLNTNHTIHFDRTKVIAKIPKHYIKIVREATEIRKHPSTCNRDRGLDISNTWLPIINSLKKVNSIQNSTADKEDNTTKNQCTPRSMTLIQTMHTT